jgi:hypothetical protein
MIPDHAHEVIIKQKRQVWDLPLLPHEQNHALS